MDDLPTTAFNVNSCNTDNGLSGEAMWLGERHDVLWPLWERVVSELMYDSSDVDDIGACHPGTRIFVLEAIMRWIDDRHPAFALTWLKGAHGTGKSAIARTVAKRLVQDHLLLASVFCFRHSSRRNNASLVIPTLVDQIITRIPSLRPIIEDAFESDPHILSKSMEVQARRLIIEPLAAIGPELRDTLPRVVIVDGLDELKGDKNQCDILNMIAFLVDNIPFPIHFLVTSRPEHQIQDYFAQSMGSRWIPLSLDETYHPDHDILVYYKDHFSQIVIDFPSFKLASDWPGGSVRRMLVAKGSGQLTFATIVIRFVGNPSIAISPQKRLDMILEGFSDDKLRSLEPLDVIYATVFKVIPEEELQGVLQIVGLVLMPNRFTKSPRVLDSVLCLEPGTTENRLRWLHPVLEVPSSSDASIELLHATLGGFLFDHHRSHLFGLHIDQKELQRDAVLGILKGSMVYPASERLLDCFRGWFKDLYYDPIRSPTLIDDPAFRSNLMAHIRKVRAEDVVLWSPLALSVASPLFYIKALKCHSSWLNLTDRLYWWIMQRRVANEVLRRWWSYVKDMGVTGQMLLFLDLLSQRVPGFYGSESMHTFLKALPDQDALVSQKRFGMAFPFAPSDGRPAFLGDNDTREIYFMLAKPFVDPIFLETFCTLFPWHLPHPYDPDSILTAGIPLLFPSKGGDAALLRVLALQNLPEDNPRWSGEATMAFSTFMDSVLDAGARIQAKASSGPGYDDAKKMLLERAAARGRKKAGR